MLTKFMKLTRRSSNLVNGNLKTRKPRKLHVKSTKHMRMPHDIWTCQLGRTGQLISGINLSLKTIKSFIKDLYAVCPNCDHREEPPAASETRGTAEHEGLLVFLRLKIDRRKQCATLNTSFVPKVAPK